MQRLPHRPMIIGWNLPWDFERDLINRCFLWRAKAEVNPRRTLLCVGHDDPGRQELCRRYVSMRTDFESGFKILTIPTDLAPGETIPDCYHVVLGDMACQRQLLTQASAAVLCQEVHTGIESYLLMLGEAGVAPVLIGGDEQSSNQHPLITTLIKRRAIRSFNLMDEAVKFLMHDSEASERMLRKTQDFIREWASERI